MSYAIRIAGKCDDISGQLQTWTGNDVVRDFILDRVRLISLSQKGYSGEHNGAVIEAHGHDGNSDYVSVEGWYFPPPGAVITVPPQPQPEPKGLFR